MVCPRTLELGSNGALPRPGTVAEAKSGLTQRCLEVTLLVMVVMLMDLALMPECILRRCSSAGSSAGASICVFKTCCDVRSAPDGWGPVRHPFHAQF